MRSNLRVLPRQTCRAFSSCASSTTRDGSCGCQQTCRFGAHQAVLHPLASPNPPPPPPPSPFVLSFTAPADPRRTYCSIPNTLKPCFAAMLIAGGYLALNPIFMCFDSFAGFRRTCGLSSCSFCALTPAVLILPQKPVFPRSCSAGFNRTYCLKSLCFLCPRSCSAGFRRRCCASSKASLP